VLTVGELTIADPTSWIHAEFDWMLSFDGRLETAFKIPTLAALAFIVAMPWILNLGRNASGLRNG